MFVFGLLLYVAGVSQQILAFEIGSFVVVTMSLVCFKFGTASLRAVWFPFFFMFFMIPLPSAIVSALTLPMKIAVSYVTEHLLFWAGYPIARSGVILQIGQYQLLVADACAGLQTLLTLEALGLFYLNLVRHTSPFRNIVLATLIIPISFTANVIRVVTLTLITYYFGDAAGQGFLHGFAGMVLFISALILIISLDTLLQWIVRRAIANAAGEASHEYAYASEQVLDQRRDTGSVHVVRTMARTACDPTIRIADSRPKIMLETAIPAEFGDWQEDRTQISAVVNPTALAEINKIYNQTLTRTYVNRDGERIMLSIAYGTDQSDNLSVHFPEGCYGGQGFAVGATTHEPLETIAGSIPASRLVATLNNRNEPIIYWVVVGEKAVNDIWQMKKVKLAYALDGRIPDATLMRVSTITQDNARGFTLAQEFVNQMLSSMTPAHRRHFSGQGS